MSRIADIEATITKEKDAAIGDLGPVRNTLHSGCASFSLGYRALLPLIFREVGIPMDGRKRCLGWICARSFWGEENVVCRIRNAVGFRSVIAQLLDVHLTERGDSRLVFALVERKEEYKTKPFSQLIINPELKRKKWIEAKKKRSIARRKPGGSPKRS